MGQAIKLLQVRPVLNCILHDFYLGHEAAPRQNGAPWPGTGPAQTFRMQTGHFIAAAAPTVAETDGSAITDQSGKIDFDSDLIFERVDNIIDGTVRLLPNFVLAVIIFFAVLLVGRLIRRLIRKAFSTSEQRNIGIVLARIANWISIFAAIMLATMIIVPDVGVSDLLAGLGVGGVAIGFAFKDILQNLLAGILILLRQPFRIGDQIRFGEYEGTVEHIETRATIIKTYDGRQIVIPNGEIFTNPFEVDTAYPLRRSEYSVGVGYGDDMDKAAEKMREAILSVDGVEKDPEPQVLAMELGDSTVNLEARWWTQSRKADKNAVHDRVIRAIKKAMDDNFIDMPFPTQIVLLHDQTEETDGDRMKQREGWPAGPNSPKPARISSVSTPADS